MIKELNEKNFQENIEKGYTLIDFYAPWCGPCKMMTSVIDDLDKDNIIKIYKVNIDSNQGLALRYQVSSIPTLVLFKDGQQIALSNGYIPKQKVVEFINKNKK